jgi:hypothetical protein
MKTLQIITTVHYDDKGVSFEQLKEMATKAIDREMKGGTFTGSTSAMVTFYECEVNDISPMPIWKDKPGREYRDMQQSDFSSIHMDPPPPTHGWVREMTPDGQLTGRMSRPIPAGSKTTPDE